MRVRRIITAAVSTAAAASLVLPAPGAQAAESNIDTRICVAAARQTPQENVSPASMTLLAEEYIPLTGITGTVHQVSYQLPEGYRCDVARVHVPSAAAGRKVTYTAKSSELTLVTDGAGYEFLREDASWEIYRDLPTSDLPPSYNTPAGTGLIHAAVYDTSTTSFTSGNKTYYETAQPLRWTLQVNFEAWSTTVTAPASPEVVATATRNRDAAITASSSTLKKERAQATKAYHRQRANAKTLKKRRAALAKYVATLKTAKKNHTARLAAAETAYQAAIVPVVTTTTDPAGATTSLSGQVPPTS